jgi:hypothetical protein
MEINGMYVHHFCFRSIATQPAPQEYHPTLAQLLLVC